MSLFFSYIIDLYNFKLLTAIVKIAGIKNKFGKTNANKQKNILLLHPIAKVIEDIV